MFIATCNTLDTIPTALRDRMEVIELPGYTEEEKLHIANGYLVTRQLKENGLDAEQCRWSDEAIRTVIEDYTREAGVRNLERRIGAVCRNIASQIAKGETAATEISPEKVREVLGPAEFIREEKLKTSRPGVVTGLAYTAAGGDTLHIEAISYPGKGNIILTGQLGDVMQESVRAAYSLVRSKAEQLDIEPGRFEETDVHVHVPAGAVPKDGPSAGIAMFAALVSLYTNRPVNKDVAMTGEITLRGLVLPIGGLKEKTIAALRSGVKTVLVPKLNEKDLPELPEEVKERLTIIPVETVDEVLKYALEKD
jgi:ATP-dependent Lon protease